MKTFGFALLCLFAAVQGRSLDAFTTALQTPAAAGENPWLVHLRIATSQGQGLLSTCVGSLIGESFVLTAASCVSDARFIWIRYGAINVIRPEMVTESNTVVINPDYDSETGANNIALINLNRIVGVTDNIGPIELAAANNELPSTGKICGYGANEEGAPGEQLLCVVANLTTDEDGNITATSDEGQATEFDVGAPIVSDGVQVGVLSSVSEDSTVVINPSQYADWIAEVTAVAM